MKPLQVTVLLIAALSLASSTFAADPKPNAAEDAEIVETRREVPKLKAAAPYQLKGNTVEIELSQYAGYSGLIAANGGLEPSEESIFFKKHGFKVKFTLSEEESWSKLNSGGIAASATTADVLAVYGRQFDVVIPALIGFSRGADGVVVRSDIKRINDLKGKTLSSCQFTESDFFIRYLAQEAGLEINLLDDLTAKPDPERINIISCADGFGAGDLFLRDLKAGRNRLAGCVTWAPKTSEVADGSAGKAHVLATNRNLLIVADVLIVNKGFATANPKIVASLVDGLIAGNAMVRANPAAYANVIGKALKWDAQKTKDELAKVHLANLPENLSFFDGTIDSAGSYGYIYESAVAAYGKSLIKTATEAEAFPSLAALKALEKSGTYAAQKPEVVPIRTIAAGPVEEEPLLSKNIRFLFQPNSSRLDMTKKENLENLERISRAMKVSPGSTILLRGHAEDTLKKKYLEEGGEALVRQVGLTAMQLSKDRAEEVRKILIDKYSVDEVRIRAIGRGWEEPVSKVGAENRRVEMQWFTVE
jgi:NitT/TauT family transport system substrate-binding protein